jgi:replicative DNA helicase
VPIKDLVGQQPEVWALDDDKNVVAARAEIVWSTGVKPVLDLKLASGARLRATADHRVMAGERWKAIGECTPGDRVAIARKLPEVQSPLTWPEHWLVLLGHLVGDGSYLTHQPLRYTTASEDNSSAVAKSAELFGSKVTRHAGVGNWHQLVISGNGNRWHSAGVGKWLKGLGIFNQRSHEKRLPGQVFQLSKSQIATLLKHLWATDGCIGLRKPGTKGNPRVYFATCSEGLASDVAALLMRLGIVARRRHVQQGKGRPVHTVDVSGRDNQLAFVSQVGGFGPRAARAQQLKVVLAESRSHSNVDTLPKSVFRAVTGRVQELGITGRAMSELRGSSHGGLAHFNFAPSTKLVSEYAELVEDPQLGEWAKCPLFWDRVVEVAPAGNVETFDLTVPNYSNWLADCLTTHNSGAIEQDADMILLIYRDEVYNKETPKKGVAEIDLAKHRNGETGDIRLTFRGANARFENYADPAYGEGIMR